MAQEHVPVLIVGAGRSAQGKCRSRASGDLPGGAAPRRVAGG